MKTTTFGDILYQAAELAQRTRDKLPGQEQISVQGFLATEFQLLFTSQAWPELIPAIVAVAPANRMFSKNEGAANEMGDILGVMHRNPETGSRRDPGYVAFSEGDNTVYVDSNATSLWVEYLLPYPGVTFVDLQPGVLAWPAFLLAVCPRRWRNILAHRAAGHLLNSDGNAAGAGVQYGLAQAALVSEILRLPPLPWWRATARLQRPRERQHHPGCQT